MACATLKRSYEFDPFFGFPYESFAKRLKLSNADEIATTCHNPKVSSTRYIRVMPDSKKTQFYKNPKPNHERIVARIEAPEFPLFVQDHHCKKYKFSFEKPMTDHAAPLPAVSSPTVKTPQIPTKTRASPPTKEPLMSTSAAGYICDNVVDEHARKLREHYENVLNSKLASQLEGYVRQNLEILRNRYAGTSVSYTS